MAGKVLLPLIPKTPTHLDHVCPLITRVGLLDRLGAGCEYVLEETPVRSTTQEIFTHRHKSSQIDYGVWSEVVELSPKEVQKATKGRMMRQRKPAVDVGGEENALTLPRLRLGLVAREPRRFVGDQSPLHQIAERI